jgi:hypothetical protein
VTRRAAALIIMLVSINSPTFSWAKQLTLPCKFEGSERLGAEREKDVNQIYVDTDIPVVELRVAQTMGTTAPIYFGFRNRQAKGMTDDKVLLHFLGSKMSMAAIRMGTPMSIVLDRLSGSMVWSWADETGSRAYRYFCKS